MESWRNGFQPKNAGDSRNFSFRLMELWNESEKGEWNVCRVERERELSFEYCGPITNN